MKFRTLTCITAMTVFAALVAPIRLAAQDQQARHRKQTHYAVKELGTLGGTQSGANTITNNGWAEGWAELPDGQTEHAVLWRGQAMTDLGTLGGPSSAVSFPVHDDRGVIVGNSETSNTDPLGEDFCGFAAGTGLICLGFHWQDGVMTPLPTLGGNNAWATGANNRGQAIGIAENSTQDPSCIPPQVLDYEAVIWGPKPGEIHELSPLSGDSVSGATAINDNGQVVGASGTCAPVSIDSPHAVLWQHGSVTNLGSLGGVTNNLALGINNRGEVVGISDLAGDATFHAFVWTRDEGMRDLGTLPGDFLSFANTLNEAGQVVGQSCDESGNCRAFLWQDGVMTDLNTLIPPQSSLYLTDANDINDHGEIVGYAFDQSTGDTPGYLAVPADCGGDCEANLSAGQKVALPENVRERLRQRRGFGRFGAGLMRSH